MAEPIAPCCKDTPVKTTPDECFLGALASLTLYGPNGAAIEPKIKGNRIEYDIPGHSLYYHRRR